MTVKRPPKAGRNVLLEAMLEDLGRSGLGAEEARKMGLRPGDPNELEAMGLPSVASYEIPYLNMDGNPTGFRRWRYLEDTRRGAARQTDRKPIRYVQPSDTLPELYLAPLLDWRTAAADPTCPLVLTEGEKKAAAVCLTGTPCVGLGGVYSFRSNARGLPLIRGFTEFEWKGRDVVVAYDSDSSSNHMVVAARNALCRELLALGALPRVAELPHAPDGSKQGCDDLLVAQGEEALGECFALAVPYSAAAGLYELNEEVVYVRRPGVVVRLSDAQMMRPYDFTSHAYANRHHHEEVPAGKGETKMVKKSSAKAWLEWTHRYELAAMAYAPGEERVTDDGRLNTWPGWGCEPKKGSVRPWIALLDRLFHGYPKERQWFEQWCALPLQRPGSKMFTCAVVWGVGEGTGKSLLGKTLGRIYGKNYAIIGDKQLQDSRNEWAINKQFVLGDDVTGHENRKYAEKLKAVIVQETMLIDPKYVQSYSVPDVLNYLFTSNRPDAFFLDDNDRRNFVHEVECAPMTKAQVAEFFDWLDNGGAAHLFDHLLRLDLDGMEAADRAPNTAAKAAMVDDGQSALARWVRDVRTSPETTLSAAGRPLPGDLWSSQDLLQIYDPDGRKGVSASAVSREMKRAGVKMVYRGQAMVTAVGQRRLFAVKNAQKWCKEVKSAEMAAHYAETRLNAKGKKF